VASVSNRLSNRYIISLVKAKKALAKKQLKLEMPEMYTLSSLNCFELEPATVADCICLNIEDCTNIMKSVKKLPTIDNTIQVMSIDGRILFTKTEATTLNYALNHSRIGREKPKFYILNDYLYVANFTGKYVKVIADFEDEEDVEILNNTCSTSTSAPCFNALDLEMSGETMVIDRAITLASQEFMRLWAAGSEDNLNNAKSNNASREQEDLKIQNA
jgi:hypothetical protein